MFSRHPVIVISAESLNNHPPFQLASPERKMRICVKQTDFNSQKKSFVKPPTVLNQKTPPKL